MVVAGNGIETKVWILPYEKSTIDKNMYVPSRQKAMVVTLELADCTTVVLKADQLITAIKKCVL